MVPWDGDEMLLVAWDERWPESITLHDGEHGGMGVHHIFFSMCINNAIYTHSFLISLVTRWGSRPLPAQDTARDWPSPSAGQSVCPPRFASDGPPESQQPGFVTNRPTNQTLQAVCLLSSAQNEVAARMHLSAAPTRATRFEVPGVPWDNSYPPKGMACLCQLLRILLPRYGVPRQLLEQLPC
ncbi:uncharacterized protein UV8b_01717 [Ustilaginoidea virens]|uniref:Uncharacterized protein n=1 Tax=Ustilaginoidea virens TaxID=1159556 RepID=A0A8E5MEN9_USTVR|nr:uncharacterized protein UV8b_01717 [Ustilaginoidea virens]QUC17476.1 hypothetical protein UV8b_01717 [Ustilaginoidea virens]